MDPTTLQSLATQSRLSGLRRALSNVDSFYHEGAEDLPALKQLIKKEIQEDPRLAGIKIHTTPGLHGGYFPSKDQIAIGVINPAVLAHELGHAKNIRKSKIYGKILMATKNVARLNNTAALPAMLAIRALVQNKDTRDEILNILSGTSAALAAPGLAEEFSASLDAIKNAPSKLQAIKTLLPAFLSHTLSASIPIGIYQAGKYI